MAVMASHLSNLLAAQEQSQNAEQRGAQDHKREEEFREDHHGSKAFRTQQGIGEVKEQAERDEAGERVIEGHIALL